MLTSTLCGPPFWRINKFVERNFHIILYTTHFFPSCFSLQNINRFFRNTFMKTTKWWWFLSIHQWNLSSRSSTWKSWHPTIFIAPKQSLPPRISRGWNQRRSWHSLFARLFFFWSSQPSYPHPPLQDKLVPSFYPPIARTCETSNSPPPKSLPNPKMLIEAPADSPLFASKANSAFFVSPWDQFVPSLNRTVAPNLSTRLTASRADNHTRVATNPRYRVADCAWVSKWLLISFCSGSPLGGGARAKKSDHRRTRRIYYLFQDTFSRE